MSNKSPMEKFKTISKVWALLCVLLFGGCSAGFYFDAPYSEKVSHNATLELAYIYNGSCDKHGNRCVEKYKGRFKADDGNRYDRDIDGFFYHRFVDEGRKEMPAYITLSKNDMGTASPTWVLSLMLMGLIFAIIFLAGGFSLMLYSSEVEYDQRKWEHDQKIR